MEQLDFGRLVAPTVSQHLHDDADAVDGDTTEGL